MLPAQKAGGLYKSNPQIGDGLVGARHCRASDSAQMLKQRRMHAQFKLTHCPQARNSLWPSAALRVLCVKTFLIFGMADTFFTPRRVK